LDGLREPGGHITYQLAKLGVKRWCIALGVPDLGVGVGAEQLDI